MYFLQTNKIARVQPQLLASFTLAVILALQVKLHYIYGQLFVLAITCLNYQVKITDVIFGLGAIPV